MKYAFGIFFTGVAICSSISAEPRPAPVPVLTLRVAAGKHDRLGTPVALRLPEGAAGARFAVIEEASGMRLPAQLAAPGLLSREREGERELHFIVTELKAGQSTDFKVIFLTAEPDAAPQFRWRDTAGIESELRFGERPVLRYMYQPLDESTQERREATYKVFHHLFDPKGERLVTKGPGGKYTHHRGLFYGFNKVSYGSGKTCDIWHCTGDTHQAHEAILASEAGPVLGRHRLAIRWHGPGKEVFAREERELAVYNLPGGQLVEFASRLKSLAGPVKLDGDPQHAGFHFRADNEVSEKAAAETYYIRPDGIGKPGETRNWEPKNPAHKNLPWDAMSFVLGGRRYTALYLDRPENPKEARYSERDYGRFGSYFEHQFDDQKPLEVRYRIWLQAGALSVEEAAAKSADFTDPPAVEVK